MTQRDYKYKAFISYSHQDKKWGDWLHKGLETYRVPKGLVGKQTGVGVVPKRLFPIFRDREELPTSHELGRVINKALDDSSHLIVICSPRSAKSLWVNEEIKQFKRLGKSDNILCLIVDGEPNAADKPGLEEEECFPEAAKYEIGEDGELSNIRTEPIAADAREGKDGKRNALLKLAAGLLAVGFDDLNQRDLARKQKRMAIFSGVSFALVAIMAGLTFWALDQQREAERQRTAAVQSQQEAETERAEAQKQLKKANAISEFVQGLFTSVQPGELENIDQGDMDLMKLVLGKGLEKIGELEDQPQVEAEIRNVLGTTYHSLGFYDQALTHHEKALAIRLKILGTEHSSVAEDYFHLGEAQKEKADFQKALELYNKALAISLKLHGQKHPKVAQAYDCLGQTYGALRDYDKAIEHLEKSLSILLESGLDQRPDVQLSDNYYNLAKGYLYKGKYEKSKDYVEKCLAIELNLLGADHPSVAHTYALLARVLSRMGEREEVIRFYEKTLAMHLKNFGLEHHYTGISYNDLAVAYNANGDHEIAIEYFEKALAIYSKTLGSNHPSIASLHVNISMPYRLKGEIDKAIEHLETGLALLKAKFGSDANSNRIYYNLGLSYLEKGENDLALEQFQLALSKLLKEVDAKHPNMASTFASMGVAYDNKGDKANALKYLEKAKAIQLKKLGPDHPDTKKTQDAIDKLRNE